MPKEGKVTNNVDIKAVMASRREDDLIYNDLNPSLWARIKTFFAQLFEGKKDDVDNSRTAINGDLDNVQANNDLQNMSMDQKCEKSFENFYSMDDKDKIDIKSLNDANELGQSLTSTKSKDREKEGGFYKLVSEPLDRLAELEEGSDDYNMLKDKLVSNLDKYMDSHNPHSKIGKARCEFAQRLRFALAQENELEDDDIEDENENDIEDENENKGFLEDCHIVDAKEKTSIANLEKKEREEKKEKPVGITKSVNQKNLEMEVDKSL